MKKVIFLLCLLAVSGATIAQISILDEPTKMLSIKQIDASRNLSETDINTALTLVFDSLSNASKIKGFNAAVLLPDGSMWTAASGVAKTFPVDLDMATDHQMGIGSITKTFIAATIMSMIEEGLLTLDTRLDEYLGDYVNIDETVTIRQALSHRTGFHDYLNDNDVALNTWSAYVDSIWIVDTVMANFVFEPNFPVDSTWSYSNTNYLLAGLLIESITGNPWYVETRARVIEPLGLENTFSFPYEDLNGNIMASPFLDVNNDNKPIDITGLGVQPDGLFSLASSAGCIVGTPSDLNHFVKGVFGGNLLSPSSINEMQTDYIMMPPDDLQYGLGSLSFPTGTTNWGHNGSLIYQSAALYFEEFDLAIAVQQNDARLNDTIVDIYNILEALLEVYLECQEVSSLKEEAQIDFHRVYPNPSNGIVIIEVSDSFLNPANRKPMVQLFDCTGRSIRNFLIADKRTELELEDLSSGLYFLKIGDELEKFYKK